MNIALLPGDGIGPEVTDAAVRVLEAVSARFGLSLRFERHPVGGAAVDSHGTPLPGATLAACLEADAVLLGAVGGPKWDTGPAARRPEAGLLGLRKALGTFANLRPVRVPDSLAAQSPIRDAGGVDLLIVRELTGGVYFGTPRVEGSEEALDTMRYSRPEVERIARVAGTWARQRSGRITSVDKANVLASSRLWRRVATETLEREFPDLEVDHMYVDNAAMQIARNPRQFDVILTGNLFGDILSDLAATLPGSLGVLPSASIGEGVGIFEPVHGSAPDITGQDRANPLGMVLSAAMMLDHLGLAPAADCIREAVESTLREGLLTADMARDLPAVGTIRITDAICDYAAGHAATA